MILILKLQQLNLNCFIDVLARCRRSVECATTWHADSRRFYPHVWQHSFVDIGHEIISTAILSLLLIQEGQLSVTCERMCTECW